MIAFLIVRDAWLRAAGPVVLVVVVIESTAAAVPLVIAAASARLLRLTRLVLARSRRGLGGRRVDLLHITVAVVGHADVASVYFGQRGWEIVLHQVLVLKVVVRVVVDVLHLGTATAGSPMVAVRPTTTTD